LHTLGDTPVALLQRIMAVGSAKRSNGLSMPETGSPRPSLGVNARIAVIFPYVLIYDYDRDSNTLTLLRILHGRRNISQDLLRR
jgi:plasmid stabilization system protein ParE